MKGENKMDIKNLCFETAWMYCRECDKFDDGMYPKRPCSGKAFDYEIKDGNPPCSEYRFNGEN